MQQVCVLLVSFSKMTFNCLSTQNNHKKRRIGTTELTAKRKLTDQQEVQRHILRLLNCSSRLTPAPPNE